ncbi:MAG: N-6 DNA methylase, partial [Lachnospiraceae bacterium]|nr:N-6 DNA methylase [Lachnospiraceae bacterium]
MSHDIRNVVTINRLMAYFGEVLKWEVDVEDFEDIDDISYEFEAEELGLKEEAFVKIKSIRQLQPLVDGQKWGIFTVEFDSKKLEVTALRKVLSGLIPKKRNSSDHAVWDQKDLLFICFWGEASNRTLGIAHFEEKEVGLPQIKMIYCAPAIEDPIQLEIFKDKLSKLSWPIDIHDTQKWHDDWSSAFTTVYKQTIRDSSTLTTQLAKEAKGIRDRILDTLKIESKNGYVHSLYAKFKDALIHDMTKTQFADMYAQTVVYGLFSARCMDDTQDDFSAEEAIKCLPNTNPFLKNLMKECLGEQKDSKLSYDELEIGNIVDLLLHTKTDEIIKDFNRQTGGGKEDPVIHFYEEFLTAYDKEQKVKRGVYYTPQPVVNFMVRAVDSLLKSEFGLEDGIASTKTKKIKYIRPSKKRYDGFHRGQVEDTMEVPEVQILDPATGTGTFLRQTILQIYENFNKKNNGLTSDEKKKAWNEYVGKQLLPRLNGFELMMAPYAVAHMKLAMVLKNTGYDFGNDERLRVFLTNTLSEPGNAEAQMNIFDDPLANESVEANAAKKNNGINIVIGNPPYSAESANKDDWIMKLMEDYKKEPGGIEKLKERNPKWINDDYVKFIRYAQYVIENAGNGILAYICPHGFLENPTFRGMRWWLMSVFDDIYIINLHGNSKKQEKCPDGTKDENVFDIQQGVCINILVKHKKSEDDILANVFYKDVYGLRDFKYSFLVEERFHDIKWQRLYPESNMYYMIPKNFEGAEIYYSGFSVLKLFMISSQGVLSGNDACVMYESYLDAERVAKKLITANSNIELEKVFEGKKKAKNWSLIAAKEDLEKGYRIERIKYRPFDDVFSAYTGRSCGWHWRPRTETMNQLLECLGNICMVMTRIVQKGRAYNHIFISDSITDKGILSSKDNAFVFPLYIYDESNGNRRRTNLDSDIVNELAIRIGLIYDENKNTDEKNRINSYDVFCYAYALLWSPSYRMRFNEFLIIDFPYVQYPSDADLFWKYVKLGEKLINVQLMKKNKETRELEFIGLERRIELVEYQNKMVKINKESFIGKIPENVWKFTVGSYQPAQKWLK